MPNRVQQYYLIPFCNISRAAQMQQLILLPKQNKWASIIKTMAFGMLPKQTWVKELSSTPPSTKDTFACLYLSTQYILFFNLSLTYFMLKGNTYVYAVYWYERSGAMSRVFPLDLIPQYLQLHCNFTWQEKPVGYKFMMIIICNSGRRPTFTFYEINSA